ncbi:MAG: protein kinase [Lactobacillus sp.]|nr:protein kinase [Lactobacillus sp.]
MIVLSHSKLSVESEFKKLLSQNNIKKINKNDIWAYPSNNSLTWNELDNYGWKIHISAIIPNAIQIAQEFIGLAKLYELNFKILASLNQLEKINLGYYGNSQIGKFITIYPKAGCATKTLELLHYKFHNFVGIKVGSDFSYKLNSNIYYRFGTILNDIYHIDKRDKKLSPPSGYETIEDYSIPHYHEIPTRYLIIKTIKKVGLSGVYYAIDLKNNYKVIIRYATQYYNLDSFNVDDKDRLLNSYHLLKSKIIYESQNFEKPLDIFYIDNAVFLVTKFENGSTINDLILNKEFDCLDIKTRIFIFNKIISAINLLNENGFIFRDLSLSNIILSDDLNIKIIDFDYCISTNINDLSYPGTEIESAGTFGFFNPNIDVTSIKTDRYSLAKIFYFFCLPSNYRSLIKECDFTKTYSEVKETIDSCFKTKLESHLEKYYKELLEGKYIKEISL